MFKDWLSGDRFSSYVQSRYKERVDHVGGSLLRERYLPVVVRLHLHEWVRFVHYLEEHDLPIPSSFHDSQVQRYVALRFPRGSSSRLRGIRASIRIFIDVDNDGQFPRRMRTPQRPTNALYAQAVPRYLDFLRRHRGVSERTISKRAFHLDVFTRYLERAGVPAWKDVEALAIRTFLTTQLIERKPPTRLTYAGSVRGFHRWAYLEGVLDRDLSKAATAVRQYRLTGIPDVLSEDEVNALLKTVDRASPLGRRDYAVLMLAARYGMRVSDIRQLSIDHINWRRREISMRQSKTGRPLLLPLLYDVSEALIDYLRNGRPESQFRNIFVRHVAPHEPYSPNNNMPGISREALRRAGLENRRGRKGLHLLRHTLATRMLSAGNSIKTIGDVLGHVNLDSTLIYTKVDLSALRTVALSVEEMLR